MSKNTPYAYMLYSVMCDDKFLFSARDFNIINFPVVDWWMRSVILGPAIKTINADYTGEPTYSPPVVETHRIHIEQNCTRSGRPTAWATRLILCRRS